MSSAVGPKDPPLYLSVAAGMLGQCAELVLGGHVLNRVATELMAHPERGSVTGAVRHLYAEGGLKEFYKGLNWNLVQGCCKGATRWGFNNLMFRLFAEALPKGLQEKHRWILPAAVGLGGAAVETALYLCPLESMKTRRMTGPEGFVRIVKQEGIPVFFKGWTGLYGRQAITWTTYLVVYDKARDILLKYREKKEVTVFDKFTLNAVTGTVACLLNTPLDMLRTQFQKHEPLRGYSLLRAANLIMSDHGVKGLYSSLPIRIARSVWYAVSTFTVMDYLNALPKRMQLS